MDTLQLRLTTVDAAQLIEAITEAQEHSEDHAWNRDVQVIKARLLAGIARADRRAARAAAG